MTSVDLSRRAVVVTGGTGNLGRVVVRACLDAGAHVALPVRDDGKAAAVVSDLDAERVIVERADPSDARAMDAFVERVLRAWGRLDVLVNTAGGFATAPSTDLDAIRRLWQQNVETVLVASAACLRPMRARGYGRIVSVSSTAALRGGKNAAGYSIAKTAIVRWTESIAPEVKDEGVTVNAVLPSIIDDAKNRAAMPNADVSKWPTPEQVTAVILFLCSEEAGAVTGAAIPITGRT